MLTAPVPVSTGFNSLNRSIGGGFFPSELTVIASRPGIGKTSLMDNMISRIHNTLNIPVLFFSTEMAGEYQQMRFISLNTKIPLSHLRENMLKTSESEVLSQFNESLNEETLIMDDTPNINIDDLCKKAYELHSLDKVQIIFIDYIGLITTSDESRLIYEKVHEVTDKLKKLARELKIPVVVNCELARDEANTVPSLAQLRGSGSIENTADVIILMHEESQNEHYRKIVLDIAKNKNGSKGKTSLFFYPDICKFEEETV